MHSGEMIEVLREGLNSPEQEDYEAALDVLNKLADKWQRLCGLCGEPLGDHPDFTAAAYSCSASKVLLGEPDLGT